MRGIWHFFPGKAAFESGTHGYDNEEPKMRAMFIASGPAFRKNTTGRPFDNVHVHPMITNVLGLKEPTSDVRPDRTTADLDPLMTDRSRWAGSGSAPCSAARFLGVLSAVLLPPVVRHLLLWSARPPCQSHRHRVAIALRPQDRSFDTPVQIPYLRHYHYYHHCLLLLTDVQWRPRVTTATKLPSHVHLVLHIVTRPRTTFIYLFYFSKPAFHPPPGNAVYFGVDRTL